MTLYQCFECGEHYEPWSLVIEPGRLFPVCADRARCRQAKARLTTTPLRRLDR